MWYSKLTSGEIEVLGSSSHLQFKCVAAGLQHNATTGLTLLDELPDNATWEDVQCSIYVRERIERGRQEADQGNLISQDEIEKRIAELKLRAD